jgi:glycosyltransferase involved in cell wall biosynthesis
VIRIAYLITDLEIGGTERFLERLVSHLSPDFQTCVLSLVGEGPIGKRLPPNVEVVHLKMKGKWDASVLPRALRVLQKFQPHILHTFLFHANVLGRILEGLRKTPRTLCSLRTQEGKAWYFPVERHTWSGFDRVICASHAVADHARKKMGLQKAEIIWNGVPLPENRTGIKTEMGLDNLVATACRLDPGKGGEAFVALAKSFPDQNFALLGGGSEEEKLRKKAGTNVHFAGWRDNVPGDLVDVDLFVHASTLGEGFPNALAEAMAAGCPVVATDVGGSAEVVGQAGILVKNNLVDAVGELLKNPDKRLQLGKEARQRAEKHFSIPSMITAYESLYRALLS